jgi:hypothetical protein
MFSSCFSKVAVGYNPMSPSAPRFVVEEPLEDGGGAPLQGRHGRYGLGLRRRGVHHRVHPLRRGRFSSYDTRSPII